MDKQLRRILNLVRKTGDRMVVTDGNGEDVYVVMGLEQYENLVIPHGITGVQPVGQDELDDVDWMEERAPEEEPGRVGPTQAIVPEVPPVPPADIWEAMTPAGTESETWDISRMSDAEKGDLERQFQNYQQEKEKTSVGTVTPAEPAAEQKSEPKDEDFGEEQFYLEPIE